MTEVLRLLTQVQLEDLPSVVETLIENFEEDVIPVAESIVAELVILCTFVGSTDSRFRSRSLTA